MRFYSISLMPICLAIFVPAISAFKVPSLSAEHVGIVDVDKTKPTFVSAEHAVNKLPIKNAELGKPPLSAKHVLNKLPVGNKVVEVGDNKPSEKTADNGHNKSPEKAVEHAKNNKSNEKAFEHSHNKPAKNTSVEHLKNKSHEKAVENEKEGPEDLSFAAKKALFAGGVVEKAKGKPKPPVKIVHENAKDGAKAANEEKKELMKWNCDKFAGQNEEKCRRWEKIERELELKINNKEEIKFNFRTLMPDGQCNFNVKMKTYSKLVLQNLIKNAFNMAKGSNGKDGVKLEEAPLSQEDCMMKLREGWQKLKGELEEQVNFTTAEMKKFGLGNRNRHEELKDAFPVDKSNLMVELKDKRTNKQMTFLEFEQIAEKVIKHNEEIQLPEKIIEKKTEDEWKKVAEKLGEFETIILNNSTKPVHSQQKIMLSYKFNNNEANLYKLLAMAKKITKLIKAKHDLPLILPPTSDGFHGMKKNWQKAANQN